MGSISLFTQLRNLMMDPDKFKQKLFEAYIQV